MVCPGCGRATTVSKGRCISCGVAFAQASIATGVIPIDTTGLPPGATFGASTGLAQGTAATIEAPARVRVPPVDTSTTLGPLHVGQSFGPRYHVIKLLGIGGMGAVYQAWDSELNVAVALKLIRTDKRQRTPSADAEKRFKHELLLARQVTHKNVVRIHDINEIDGIKYITMPFIQGHDLATVLRRDGKLPLARALHLARQIAEGLKAAHEAGVIHRDLKPANVMIGADDLALIMDFGISASTDEAAEHDIVGTLEYMAPEQGKGDGVDQRSDIYAFGLILYEMLAGPRRGYATTPQERVDAMRERTSKGLAPLRSVDPAIPEPLNALVMRCIELDAATRFQTTTELCASLASFDENGELIPEPTKISRRMLLAAACLVMIALVATGWIVRWLTPASPAQHAPVTVVLSEFENRTGDPVFDGSLEPLLVRDLERVSFINPITKTDDAVRNDPVLAGGRLDEQKSRLVAIRNGYPYVLSGRIDRAGSGYELTLRVVDPPADGKVLKSVSRRVASKEDVIKTLPSLAAAVRAQLGDTVKRDESAISETLTAGSLEAVRAYTAANQLGAQAKDGEAIVQYQRAVQLDPQLGRAYAGWALSAAKLGRTEEADELWKKALALLDRMTERERYRTLGNYYSRVVRNPEKAIENFTKLLELYPADAAGHNNLAMGYFRNLQMRKALDEGARVLQMYPKTQIYRDNYALYAMYAGDFARAAEEGRKIVEEVPSANHAYLPIAIDAALAGRFDAANDAYTRMMSADTPGPSVGMTGLGDLAVYRADYAEAERQLKAGITADEAVKDTLDRAAKMNALAEVYAAQGRADLAANTAQEVLKLGKRLDVVVPAAFVLVRAGRKTEAAAIADDLSKSLQTQTRAYGELIRGEISRYDGKVIEAVDRFRAAQKLADLWLARYMLGIAYVEAEAHDEAVIELDVAQKRRGEGAALFLDDSPTLRYLAALPYWLGRAQEKAARAESSRKSFEQYIALRGNTTPPDPLAADARKRLAP